jgi:AraC-like DNA-binding protein
MRILGSYVWMMVLDGKAFYKSESGDTLPLNLGDCILFGPDERHAYGSADGKTWEQIYIVFSGPIFDALWQSPTFRHWLPAWHIEPTELWLRQLEELLSAQRTDSPEDNLQTLTRFANILVKMSIQQRSGLDNRLAWLDTSRTLLGEPRQGRWLGAHEVARTVGKSYESFRKQFREAVGRSPQQFQQQRRIEWASAAIYRGNNTFKEIAEWSGFCDVYHFSHTFRKVTGMTPSQYREKVRG